MVGGGWGMVEEVVVETVGSSVGADYEGAFVPELEEVDFDLLVEDKEGLVGGWRCWGDAGWGGWGEEGERVDGVGWIFGWWDCDCVGLDFDFFF